jgi:hypothetical protein
MRIAFTAETKHWTFVLDEEGVCRSVVPTPAPDGVPTVRSLTRDVQRIVGAQFLGAVDAAGCFAGEPRVGAPMLFGYVDSDSRIRVLRTSPVCFFDTFDEASDACLDAEVDELLALGAGGQTGASLPRP